ncbi:MAG: outer membrane lipoprotein carrier protein LolA [Caulobacteraceae bacterium]|nr:MAG: outer membrane lipoprotein carrier protein LolA [Caulobacteraceae bacterium]
MNRRAALAGLIALPAGLTAAGLAGAAFAAPLSAADKALVDKATAYLQGLTSARGRFIQTDPRGSQTQGDFYLQRPGKARFAYDAPASKLLVSDGRFVSEADTRLKTVNRYPLGQTPLALFLAQDVRLDKGVVISRVSRLDGGFSLTMSDGRKQTRGSLTMNFSDSPVGLMGWVVTTVQGSTRVRLTSLERVGGLDAKLFATPFPPARTTGRP